jgi:hypothetical protein
MGGRANAGGLSIRSKGAEGRHAKAASDLRSQIKREQSRADGGRRGVLGRLREQEKAERGKAKTLRTKRLAKEAAAAAPKRRIRRVK